ncbi:MAG: hypothetical protein FWD85_07600 [Microbacteriaceae bacterium]|nr:hypothetical protein [Microbacteriaceae bacterium]MCL2795156.1 hypothetical protein [Microbacteriaceae bacterium]
MSIGGVCEVVLRAMFGRPPLWRGIVFAALGPAWFVLAAIEGPSFFRLMAGVAWCLVGVGYSAVAVYDRIHRTGR